MFDKITATIRIRTATGAAFIFELENMPGPNTAEQLGEYIGAKIDAEFGKVISLGKKETATSAEHGEAMAIKPRRGRPPKLR